MKEIIKKVDKGTPLTDEELLSAVDFYTKLEDMLTIAGEKYTTTRFYVINVVNALNTFKRARGI